ncbi:MAG TPA: S1/P1 nuclease [Stellaceae bacterium]|nr:S1/P1 nuclease [Stellaceae bacterium]
MRLARIFLVLACCTLSAWPAAAWGLEGHRVIALIAQRTLEQNDKPVWAKVAALLAEDSSNSWTKTDIASEATWADVLLEKSEEARTATMAWHYVRFNPARPDLHRDCFGRRALPTGLPASHGPQDDCVVNKIEQFERELIDPSTSQKERLMALRFLLNLVGDVHEPLYAIDRGDQGGACTALAIGQDATPVRLLTYWDETLVAQAIGKDPDKGAAELAAAATPAEAKKWAAGAADDWARESFELAKSVAYAFRADRTAGKYTFPAAKGSKDRCGAVALSRADADYRAKALATVKAQLVKAGLRLALVLRDGLQ